jgi:hypothetical protein
MPSLNHRQELQPPGDLSLSPSICRVCGGSGVLRLGEQHFRTCLACLAQGTFPLALSGVVPSSASR